VQSDSALKMKRALFQFLRVIRASVFVAWSGGTLIMLFTFVFHLAMPFASNAQVERDRDRERDVAAVINEHRTTVLETNYLQLHDDMREIRTLVYWMLFGTAGLAGEVGVRLGSSVIKKKRESEL
jgi:hypothetical protein